MKNILVTGGAGFIGSHTVVELHNAVFRPVIIDNFVNSKRSVISNLEKIISAKVVFYEGEYQDDKLLEKVADEESIDGVIHFAAHKAVGESVEKPLKYYSNNVAGLVRLLEFMEKRKISNLVFSSSCTVYGETSKLPLTEKSPVQSAASPYGATKQMGEIVIRDTALGGQNLRALALRYFNPIGAHPSALIGELPIGRPSILVPYITQVAAGWLDQLTVFGDDYPTPDGTCVRDYIHVVDLAKAHVKALDYLKERQSGSYDVFNIGTGKGSSVLEVIKTFENISGQKLNYKIGARRPGDIIASYAAADKAKRELGWQSEKTLAEALTDAWRWQQTLDKNT
jgi:UDP-glucose 4-epimerase